MVAAAEPDLDHEWEPAATADAEPVGEPDPEPGRRAGACDR